MVRIVFEVAMPLAITMILLTSLVGQNIQKTKELLF